jgi:hypothetical protein
MISNNINSKKKTNDLSRIFYIFSLIEAISKFFDKLVDLNDNYLNLNDDRDFRNEEIIEREFHIDGACQSIFRKNSSSKIILIQRP